MKQTLSLILAIAMCLTLSACGKKEEVKETEAVTTASADEKSKNAAECENLINAVGEVSIGSKEAIETAERAYSALTSEEKDSISKSAVILDDARSAYIFELSKSAYSNINEAYDITFQFSFDLYEAWRIGVYEEDDANGNFAKYISSKLMYTSEDELKAGIARALAWHRDEKAWNDLSEAEKNEYIEYAGSDFSVYSSFAVFCVLSMQNTYYLNGKMEEAEGLLETAKEQMKELSEKYSDYKHYPSLKGFYTTTSAFFDVTSHGGVSFNQYKDLQNQYEKEARDYVSDLDFIFGV